MQSNSCSLALPAVLAWTLFAASATAQCADPCTGPTDLTPQCAAHGSDDATGATRSSLLSSESIRFDSATGDLVVQDEEPLDAWSGSVNVGASISEGNTNKRSAWASFDATRRGEDDRITFGANWNFADEKDAVTKTRSISQRRTRGRGQYDYFISEKAYVFAAISAENDLFADLELRLIVSGGLGYQFIEREDLKLSGEAGIAYYDEARYSGMDSDYIAARLAYHLEWQATENVKLLQDVEAIPSLEDASDIYVRKDTRLQMGLIADMVTQLQWILDYDNTPASGLDRVDHLFLISVGWTF